MDVGRERTQHLANRPPISATEERQLGPVSAAGSESAACTRPTQHAFPEGWECRVRVQLAPGQLVPSSPAEGHPGGLYGENARCTLLGDGLLEFLWCEGVGRDNLFRVSVV